MKAQALADQESRRTTLALIVLRPEPGNSQERMNQLLDAALARGLRWTDLADYLDRTDMADMAAMLDRYAQAHGLPLLRDGI